MENMINRLTPGINGDSKLPIMIMNQCAVKEDNAIIKQYTNNYFGYVENIFPYGFPYTATDNRLIKPFINRGAQITICGFAPLIIEYERNHLINRINFYDWVGQAYDDTLVMISENYVSPRYYTKKHERMATGGVSKFPITVEKVMETEYLRTGYYDIPPQNIHNTNNSFPIDKFTLQDILDDRSVFYIDKVETDDRSDPYLCQLLSRSFLGGMLCNTPFNSLEFRIDIGSEWDISPIEYRSYHKLYDIESISDSAIGNGDTIRTFLEEFENNLDTFDDILPGPVNTIMVWQSFYGLTCYIIIYRNGRNETIPVHMSRIDQHNMLVSDDVY